MENTEKDWSNIDERDMPLKEKLDYSARFDSKKYQKYRKYVRNVAGLDIKNMGLLQYHLRLKRFENHMSIIHLSMIIGCSRTQYNRMERGENRFKDEQLETLAIFYGEEPVTYKDMQEVDTIIKSFGYFNDKDRAFRLMKIGFCYMFPVFDDMGKQTDMTVFIPKDIIETTPISKDIQKQKWLEIIENMNVRLLANDKKMTEIGNELLKLKGSPEKDQIPFREKFHSFEDEQTSIINLISKLEYRLHSIEKSS